MPLFLFLLVSGVGCEFCLWLFLDFSVYLFHSDFSHLYSDTFISVTQKDGIREGRSIKEIALMLMIMNIILKSYQSLQTVKDYICLLIQEAYIEHVLAALQHFARQTQTHIYIICFNPSFLTPTVTSRMM